MESGGLLPCSKELEMDAFFSESRCKEVMYFASHFVIDDGVYEL
jgi:hypothetical protein